LVFATVRKKEFRGPVEAIRLARRACELTDYKRPVTMTTLAIAYAAAGRFPEAVKTAEQALDLARISGREDMVKQINRYLELFRVGQPFIETRRELSDKEES
jgi:spermidine synthase